MKPFWTTLFKKNGQPPARPQSVEIVIGPDSRVVGDISTSGVARIDGSVTGSITSGWLIVGSTGDVKGDVASRGTVVAGRIEGKIKSSEAVEIKSKAIVEGDVYTSKLSISEGALFDGHSYMKKDASMAGADVLSLNDCGRRALETAADSEEI